MPVRPIIEVNGLSKRYKLGQINAASLREEAERLVQRLKGQRASTDAQGEFWALRDVSFAVQPGEVVGIIGRNGAGKSTLLKLLSRVTEPTTGHALIRGRVASLLEVGTGFHPELSGRENIYLNGAMLGMTRAEIARKFDEIVAFAEVEKFLETPVKRYSSGMYVRLAFAVAAHLEPEVLIVDEVLAVGDAEFQKKCIGKMHEVSGREGRTVLFVSHNMTAVQSLCDRCIWLKDGGIELDGACEATVEKYFAAHMSLVRNDGDLSENPTRVISAPPVFRRIQLLDETGFSRPYALMGSPLRVRIELAQGLDLRHVSVGLAVSDTAGRRLFAVNTLMLTGTLWNIDTREKSSVEFTIDELPLLPGRYCVSLALVRNRTEWLDNVEQALWFDVSPQDVYGSGITPVEGQGHVFVRGSAAAN